MFKILIKYETLSKKEKEPDLRKKSFGKHFWKN